MLFFPRFLVSMEIDREWYDIRDMFFGDNYTTQNIQLAIERAAKCRHPDAEWLTKVFAGKSVQKIDEAKQVLAQCGKDDARALCFTWMLGDESIDVLEQAAKFGYEFAQAELADWKSVKQNQFVLCLSSAAQASRDAFLRLGILYQKYESDTQMSKSCYKMAADLGDINAMCKWANELSSVDPEKWKLWGVCEARGLQTDFLAFAPSQIRFYKNHSKNGAVVFQIGRAFDGHVDTKRGIVFNCPHNFVLCDYAVLAIDFYKSQLQACRKAVDAWTIVGMRLHVCKDMRKMIGLLIWNSREEAKY